MPLSVGGEASLAMKMRWRMLAWGEVHADNDSVKHRYGGHGVFSVELDTARARRQ